MFAPVLRGLIIGICLSGAMLHAASIVSNQSADTVLGQPDFTTYLAGTPSASRMTAPYGVAVDPTTGKIFVCDFNNNRVLRYSSGVALTAGADAEAVFGQPNFTTTSSNTTASTMNGPLAAAVDGNGTLWISDIFNQRLLRFANASSKATGAAADGVLGQPDFVTSNYAGATAASVNQVYSLSASSDGTLWVADTSADRVLRFDYASNKPNGANADAVFGQADFTSSMVPATPGASSLDSPLGVAIDASGTLWVADYGNNRVLRYDHATLKPLTGASADGVLGQPKFNVRYGSDSQYGFISVSGVGVDSTGTVWVSCDAQSRIMGFTNAASKPNGALADLVLGQATFEEVYHYVPATAASVAGPRQIACDSAGNIWIADTINSRVLRFHPTDPQTPAVPGTLSPPTIAIGGKKILRTTRSSIRVQGTASAAAGLTRVEYRVGHKGVFHIASGTAAWKFTAALRPGTNSISVRAVDQLGRASAPQTLTVTRK
jgi:sugar lactone lactonase YvrE